MAKKSDRYVRVHSAVPEMIAADRSLPLTSSVSPEDLDTITEEDDVGGAARKRKAASNAVLRQRKTLEEEGDGDSTSDTEPEFATSKSYPDF